MTERDYYEILSVSRTASDAEIKQAYRKMAKRYHPDLNPGDADAELKFREAAEAYEVLSNPEKRARYDRFGHQGVQFGPGGGPGFGNPEDIFAHFGDIFSDIFGFSQPTGGPRPEAGADLRYDLNVSFRQAAHGDEVTINLPRHAICPGCKGSGSTDGRTITCRKCHGSGQVRRNQGFFQISMACPECNGTGKVIQNKCPQCKGEGIVSDITKISVRIPAGVDTGTRLRIRGEGEPGLNGGPAGDLYVVLNVEQDHRWRRDGANLIFNQEISMVQAALGHRVEIPGINGPLNMDIPKGVQSETVLRIPGEGMNYPGRKQRGDMLVHVKVLTPTDLNDRQIELLKEFEKCADNGPIAKVKKAAKKIVGKAMGLD